MSKSFNPLGKQFTCALTIIPQFYQDFAPGDERADLSPLNQVDTLYRFDAPHIRVKIFNEWPDSTVLAHALASGQTLYLALQDIFAPLAVVFEPKLLYAKERHGGKLYLTMQQPTPQIPQLCRVSLPITNARSFQLQVFTGLVSYTFSYNWESRLYVC